MRESAHTKARRLLVEGRIRILNANEDQGYIAAEVRGDSARIYAVSYEAADDGWRCTCPASTACSHVKAVQLLFVVAPREETGGSTEQQAWSPYTCVDCGIDTFRTGEFFQLDDTVWDLTGIPRDGGMACLACTEKRIGRQLVAADFVDGPPNTWARLYRSDRLLDRMASA